MTSKEKAIEIKSFYRSMTYDSKDKICAINHVEAIIEEHEIYFSIEYLNERIEYWQEVKQHLEEMI